MLKYIEWKALQESFNCNLGLTQPQSLGLVGSNLQDMLEAKKKAMKKKMFGDEEEVEDEDMDDEDDDAETGDGEVVEPSSKKDVPSDDEGDDEEEGEDDDMDDDEDEVDMEKPAFMKKKSKKMKKKMAAENTEAADPIESPEKSWMVQLYKNMTPPKSYDDIKESVMPRLDPISGYPIVDGEIQIG